jgi:hypothetical protein
LFGVRPNLLLERNFVAVSSGGRVISDPIITHEPDSSDDIEEDIELYPACAVTRNMCSRNSASHEKDKPRSENVNL